MVPAGTLPEAAPPRFAHLACACITRSRTSFRKTRHSIAVLVVAAAPASWTFPKWPCEDALLEFWVDWVLRAIWTGGRRDAWHIGFWPGNNTLLHRPHS